MEELSRAGICSPIAAQLLLNRGIATPTDADRFLRPALDHLPDPFLLPDAERAAERLKQALNRKEKVAIHGDYDGDGVTSAALWMRLLQALGGDVTVHVPHRKRDGYDMRSKFVAQAKADGATLIVTADCGIQRCDEIDEARETGIDVIITDHHEPGAELPKAAAVVNPHRKDSHYPFPWLAGVGVAFRMGEALVRHLGQPVDKYRRAYLDLAAIGTVTDIMPLHGENRVIAQFGLAQLTCTRKAGLQALIHSAGLGGRPLSSRDIGFGIGPRLNAIGRVDDAKIALDLLLTRDSIEAQSLASRLEQANTDRRQEQDRIFLEALEQVGRQGLADRACLLVDGTGWHSGVIGIVASKLVDRFNRPTIVIARDDETGLGKGSARSIPAFDLFAAISACGEHLLEFGGHSHAAGLSMKLENLIGFSDAMNGIAGSKLTEEDLMPTIECDMEVDPADVTLELLHELESFEPWGSGNEEAVFVSRGLTILEAKRIGKEQQHLKLLVKSTGIEATEALIWREGERADQFAPGSVVDLCYKPEINRFNGRETVQFNVIDFSE